MCWFNSWVWMGWVWRGRVELGCEKLINVCLHETVDDENRCVAIVFANDERFRGLASTTPTIHAANLHRTQPSLC